MSNKLYVGGLSYSTTDHELQTLFDQQGHVVSATVVMDRDSGRSRGFGFVEMSSQEEANNAINELNGRNFGGRTIMVNEAKERAPRRTGGFQRQY